MSSPDDSGATADESLAKHIAAAGAASSVSQQVAHAVQGEAYLTGLRNFLAGQMKSGDVLRSEFARAEQSDDDAFSQDSENEEQSTAANNRRTHLEFVS